MFHRGFDMLGMPYDEYKEVWLSLAMDVTKRFIKGLSDLTLSERERVLKALNEKCRNRLYVPFTPLKFKDWKKGDRATVKTAGKRPEVSEDKLPMARKIRAIMRDIGLTYPYVDGTAKKMYGVDMWEWLKPDQMRGLLAALAIHQRRVKRRAAEDDDDD
jgi:phage gp16-like protein